MRERLIRDRPAVLTAIALAIGIALAKYISSFFPNVDTLILFVSAALVLITGKFAALRIIAIVVALIFLGTGLFRLDTSSYTDTPLARIAEQKISNACLIGTLTESRETQTAYEWTIAADSIGIVSQRPIAIHGMVLLRLLKSDNTNRKYTQNIHLPPLGSRIKVFSTLEPFHSPTNPHEFAGDLKVQTDTHTEAQGSIHSLYDCYILSSPHTSVLAGIGSWIDLAHQSIVALLDTAIPDLNIRSFVKAVVLGERSEIGKETLDDFTAAGVAHILSVSGFNVAIISLVTAQLLRLLGIYWRRPRTVITMVIVLLYSAVTGFQPSVVRALIMIELYLAAQLLEREADPTNILFGAAALNLLLRPSDLFDVGFQLSYIAVFGLLQITPQLKRLLVVSTSHVSALPLRMVPSASQKILTKFGDAATLSLGASIASYPIIAAHFYRISFIGLVANLPIIPLSSVITALGFLLIPITAVSTWLGRLYGEGVTYLTNGLLALIKWCAHVPIASHSAMAPSWIYIAFLSIAVIYCLRASTRIIFIGRVASSLAVYFLLSALHVQFTDSVLARNADKLQVLFFDVGQGDCILIHTPSGKSYFVDFGPIGQNQNSQAERIVLPFLRAENATSIEAGFISHMHRDHFGGALAIAQNCSIGSIFTSGERVSEPLSRELDRTARDKHIDLRVLSRSDTLQLDSDITLYVLHPDRHVSKALSTEYGQNIHSGMLAFKLVYRKTSFLFLGDIERGEEEEMKASYGNFLHSNVVKVAHHGSLTSSSKEFIATANPEFAVISVGERNLFGHPSKAVVKRWMTDGATVCRTDLDGALLFVSDGIKVNRADWR